jgi:hypothetical protein|tara:strand:+ start:293 stop:1102 length:810 start_codon:yes stop_codon:yes gene_type:complete
MAKFDPKKADLNKDGKLSDYESNVGKKRAAAMKMGHSPKKMGHSPKKMEHSPMKKYGNGYAMKMGSKEVNSPSAFNMKDAGNMAASPMMNHEAGHYTSKQLEDFSNEVYKIYEGKPGARGGYVNVAGGTGKGQYSMMQSGLPKGVFQDYLKSGGSNNPRVAADIFQKAAKYADFSEPEGRGSGFRKKGGYPRAYYSPKDGFMGFDPQTGKKKYFGGTGKEGVSKYSSDFQEHMKTGIEVNKYGVRGKNPKKPKMKLAKVGGKLKGNILK